MAQAVAGVGCCRYDMALWMLCHVVDQQWNVLKSYLKYLDKLNIGMSGENSPKMIYVDESEPIGGKRTIFIYV